MSGGDKVLAVSSDLADCKGHEEVAAYTLSLDTTFVNEANENFY